MGKEPGPDNMPTYNEAVGWLSVGRYRESLGREPGEAFARFETLCLRRGYRVHVPTLLSWLQDVEEADRVGAMRLLWFRLYEVDQRITFVDLLTYRALGLEKLQEHWVELKNPELRAIRALRIRAKMAKTKRDLDQIDGILAKGQRAFESAAEHYRKSWPDFVRRYGNPLSHLPLPAIPQPGLQYRSASAHPDPTVALDRMREAIAAAKHPSKPDRYRPRFKWSERARRKECKRMLGDECGDAFADLEQAGRINPALSEYPPRLLEWLLTLDPSDRIEGLRLAALVENRARARDAIDLAVQRGTELRKRSEMHRFLGRSTVVDELSSEESVNEDCLRIMQEGLDSIEEFLQSDWGGFLARYGEPPAVAGEAHIVASK